MSWPSPKSYTSEELRKRLAEPRPTDPVPPTLVDRHSPEAVARADAERLGHKLGAFYRVSADEERALCMNDGCSDLLVVQRAKTFTKATIRGAAVTLPCKGAK